MKGTKKRMMKGRRTRKMRGGNGTPVPPKTIKWGTAISPTKKINLRNYRNSPFGHPGKEFSTQDPRSYKNSKHNEGELHGSSLSKLFQTEEEKKAASAAVRASPFLVRSNSGTEIPVPRVPGQYSKSQLPLVRKIVDTKFKIKELWGKESVIPELIFNEDIIKNETVLKHINNAYSAKLNGDTETQKSKMEEAFKAALPPSSSS
uniref:Uncharacterized protein n=1 Tax=viral metagenome TaxID=1070528 RepID=A0A6C0DIJ2_9ZZZZ